MAFTREITPIPVIPVQPGFSRHVMDGCLLPPPLLRQPTWDCRPSFYYHVNRLRSILKRVNPEQTVIGRVEIWFVPKHIRPTLIGLEMAW
ncbi:hypothetical protein E1B28_011017 [Marasmius oreades]|uniref:Uncharacterized protein n=1 Tax=Marasmius oreades TaxID=181124 RepID=A0A9P7RTX3_9AGAR|nr:uncharacterized protein E1B28_011017 [Marasmius oreades]KAG7089320.1 hypothetical protein E1B28_011017 [Marasmius oreades]